MEGHVLLFTPQRLFGETGSSPNALTHEPFLERARLQREQESDLSARLALGAYVVARLVDKLLALDSDEQQLEGFRWQLEAVRRHINELPADAAETAHLSGVVAAVPAQGKPTSGLWMSLTAYAYFLEHEARLQEALELLMLAARSQGDDAPLEDFAAYALFAARLNRLLARWESATSCYCAAEDAASVIGDSFSVLRGQLGRGSVQRGQGNFPAARAAAEDVLRQAVELRLPEAQAMAYADLGAVYGAQGLRLEALDAQYHAFRLSAETPQQMQALGNLAIGLSEIGALDAARLGFQIVIASTASIEVRVNALLELMDLESSVTNRVAFERYRSDAEEMKGRMSPRMSVDYHYKVGVGLARFGQAPRAKASLAIAIELAERHGLNAWYFKIEQTLGDLAERSAEQSQPRQASELSETPMVRKMEVGLREYAALAT
jgi:tetratricopeptide (TPR) repeat protein